MAEPIISFIGAGNMASSIIGGLVAKGFKRKSIIASDPSEQQLQQLQQALPVVKTTTDNLQAAAKADILVLAVKPQAMQVVARELAPALTHRPLIISIAAGINCDSLANWLGADLPIVRVMPNTPSLVECGASGLFANPVVDDNQRRQAEQLMRAVGIALWVNDEAELDAVTAVSGSGPAYFFLVMEAMQAAGEALGLSPTVARQLTLQTALGAAQMAVGSDVEPAELRRQVTSPGGTTEQAIASFEQDQLREVFARALTAARDRSISLSEELGQ